MEVEGLKRVLISILPEELRRIDQYLERTEGRRANRSAFLVRSALERIPRDLPPRKKSPKRG